MDNEIPSKYKPLSAWEYFAYQILFSIPVVGFIFLILFSFNEENINRRNFARSYFCILILVVLFIVAFLVIFSGVINVPNGSNTFNISNLPNV